MQGENYLDGDFLKETIEEYINRRFQKTEVLKISFMLTYAWYTVDKQNKTKQKLVV